MDTAQAVIRDLETRNTGSASLQASAPTRREPCAGRYGGWQPSRTLRIAKSPAMHIAFPVSYFDTLSLPRLYVGKQPNPTEPPDADPHVRWCSRGRRVTAVSMPTMPL